jgi:hypothetical protein
MTPDLQEKKKTPPLLGCIVFGFITGGLIALATPLWLLGQMGGPFSYFKIGLPIFLPALIVTTWLYQTKSLAHALCCGLGFSVPIALGCSLLPTVFGKRPFDFFSGEMQVFSWLTPPASVAYMMLAFETRKKE